MTFSRYAGMALFMIATLAAMVAAAKKPPAGELWPDTAPWAVAFLLPGALGAVLWRWRERQTDTGNSIGNPGSQQFKKNWRQFNCAADSLSGTGEPRLETVTFAAETEKVFENDLPQLIAARDDLFLSNGIRRSNELWLELARGERLLRRAQSAALDGHDREALLAYESSMTVFTAMDQVMTLTVKSNHGQSGVTAKAD